MSIPPHLNRLMTVVVQEQDAETAIQVLRQKGFLVNHLSSIGGFLGHRSVTLLVGLEAGQEEIVVYILRQSCRTRVEYVTIPLEGSPIPLPAPTPITVGGATIFVLKLDRYVEI